MLDLARCAGGNSRLARRNTTPATRVISSSLSCSAAPGVRHHKAKAERRRGADMGVQPPFVLAGARHEN